MKSKEIVSLRKTLEYIEKIEKYIQNYTFEEFCKDEKTVDATIFSLSQIGELVKNLSGETIKKYSDIEWHMIKGLRNRIVHDYEGINLKSVWYVIKHDIPELKEKIEIIVKK